MYERQLQLLRETGMVDSGVRKAFCGKVERETFFKIPGLVTNAFGYYETPDGKWVVFVTDEERGVERKRHICSSEEGAIGYVVELAENQNFLAFRNGIMEGLDEIVPEFLTHLIMEYSFSETRAQSAIEKLLRDQYIAFEFVYFVERGEFLPDKYAVSRFGYTAKRLSEETVLTVLGAFNYLIYLKEKPEEALENLKRGLPRK